MAQTEPAIDPPECSQCEIEMEHAASGTEKSVPLVGRTEIEYVRFACPECGQGARFERSGPEDDWQRAGV